MEDVLFESIVWEGVFKDMLYFCFTILEIIYLFKYHQLGDF